MRKWNDEIDADGFTVSNIDVFRFKKTGGTFQTDPATSGAGGNMNFTAGDAAAGNNAGGNYAVLGGAGKGSQPSGDTVVGGQPHQDTGLVGGLVLKHDLDTETWHWLGRRGYPTDDGVWTTIMDVPVTSSVIIQLKASLFMQAAGGAGSYGMFEIDGLFQGGSPPTQFGTTAVPVLVRSGVNVDVQFAIVGNTIEVQAKNDGVATGAVLDCLLRTKFFPIP
jgi:hypothetical protein